MDGEAARTVVQAACDALAPDFPQAPKMLLPMYIAFLEQNGVPKRREQPAYAAALEYLFHRLSGRKVGLNRIAAKYGVSPRLCRTKANRILRAVRKQAENNTKGVSMMKCINFDRAFERYMAEWMKENSEKYKDDMDVIEDMMPDVYWNFSKTG